MTETNFFGSNLTKEQSNQLVVETSVVLPPHLTEETVVSRIKETVRGVFSKGIKAAVYLGDKLGNEESGNDEHKEVIPTHTIATRQTEKENEKEQLARAIERSKELAEALSGVHSTLEQSYSALGETKTKRFAQKDQENQNVVHFR